MNAVAIRNRIPEFMVLALLVALGPACGGGGGSSASTGSAFPSSPPPVVASTPSVPMPMVNRTSGVAPMMVFCCAANAYVPGSTSTLIPQPSDGNFATFQYSWDFGDPGSGTWATDGFSKNTATGYSAAHVFENPGTYTITGTVVDAAGTTTTYTSTVVVSAFAGTTFYIDSNAGNDGNDGLSPGTAWQTIAKMFANINTNCRYLFNRGLSYDTPGGLVINKPGQSFIGAYGTGAKPIINVKGTAGGIRLKQSGWTITDLEFIGPGSSDQMNAVTLEETKQISNTLLQRLTVHEFRVNLGWSDWPTMYTTPHDGNALVENLAYNCQVNGYYVGGRQLAVLGNIVQDSATSHLVRIWQAHKGVVAHNIFARPGSDRHCLKLHGPDAGDGRPETQFVTISDNTLQGQVWECTIGSQDEVHDQRVTQVIYERNISTPTPTTQVCVVAHGNDITIRNNIFNGTGSSVYFSGVLIGSPSGLEPPAKNIRVFNNTVYKADKGNEFSVVSFDIRCSDVVIRNNLASGPLVSTMMVNKGTCPALTVDHNLLTLTPGFVNAGGGDFRLSAGSPGIDTGATLPEVQKDFAGTSRPQGAAFDLGAYEQ